jgi:hypothetical protein
MSEYKRLTIRVDNGLDEVYYPVEKDPEGLYDILDLAKYVDDGDGEEAQILLNVSNRLAQYEDIGSPEEFAELARAKVEWESSEYGIEALGSEAKNIIELLIAKAEGRLVVLPDTKLSAYEGLKRKYIVFKVSDHSLVEDCFVLRPEKDPAAVKALKVYAKACDNSALSRDIKEWLAALRQIGGGQ